MNGVCKHALLNVELREKHAGMASTMLGREKKSPGTPILACIPA